jgi:DNA gyrase/topoisomerase IV subunit B
MNSPKIMKKSKNVKKSAGNALDKKYQKKTERERVLIRPDTYIGSNDLIVNESWVFNKESKRMERKTLEYNPGFLKIFDEILTNASDHSVEFPGKVTKIDVVVNQDEGFISVYNNGPGIDIGIHKEHKCYYPELIFANLGAGTNYNDEEERLKGGRNGLGAKLAAIFSTKFDIETVSKGEIYNQSYKDNLSKIEKPKIKKTSKKEGTKITFYPDFKKLHITRISDSMLTLIEKRTMDIAACTNKDVNVTFNKEKLTIKEFENYVDLFCGTKKDTKRVIITRDRWKIIFILNPFDSFNQVSYVNGISTNYGGTHIDHVIRPVIKRTIEQLSAKHKDVDIKNNYVKDNIMVFIKSLIVNPSFKSQTKEELTTSVQNFGSRCDVTDQEIKQIIKLGIDKNVLAIAQAKSQKALSATDGKKKKKLTGVPKLNDANDAGGKESQSCTLIVTEGDSAATFAISGLAKIGKDKYGVFPLKGKPLNVRKSTTAQIGKNSEIINLKLILGLQHGKKYKDVKSLKADMRYGKIMILTDQDSVSGDTPVTLKINGQIIIKNIEDLTETFEIKQDGLSISSKEYGKCDYEVWTDQGWTNIKHIMRHKVSKKMYRVLTHTGCVDVTEDHSLLNEQGVKITPKECKIGQNLLHSFPLFEENKIDVPEKFETFKVKELWKICSQLKIQYYQSKSKQEIVEIIKKYQNNTFEKLNTSSKLTENEAWVLGFFMADGTCGVYNFKIKNSDNYRTSYSWNISNTDLSLLEKSKLILENIYKENFTIVKTNDGDNKQMFRLILNGGKSIEYIIQKYKRLVYYKKYKYIHTDILNSKKDVRQKFYNGFYEGDGLHNSTRTNYFDVNSKITTQCLFTLCKSLGYEVSINHNIKKDKIYSVTVTKGTQQNNPNKIKKIIELETPKDFYVYDLETENHHFNAGVGQMTIHNTDGSHIKGLLVNLFHYSWPLLVKESDFITCLQTPIVKIRKGNIVKSFYNLIEYENWRENENTKGWNAKYYKGLGTSSAAEARECFDGINNKLVKYTVKTPEDDESIDLAFNKDRPDDRKVWIKTSTEKNLFLDNTLRKVPIKQFFDEEFVQFSIADNVRSIPNIMDGLKPSQRKVLFVCLKNNIKKETKVIELTGEIMKTAAYHHGDASLNDTIISLSFDFVGSNNINLLSPSGQLGTRLQGGKDASSARYISAFLNPVTRSIFLPEDDEILNYLEDDGTPIEPEFYWPIVCTLLMNGTSGIGTGYSTDIPCYNPLEIINITKELIKDDEYEIPKMTPWYKGFTGTIEEKPNSENFISKGVWKRVSRGTIHITELPIGMWTRKYLEKLDKFVEEGKVFDSSDNCNDVDVDITIKMSPVELDKWINDKSVYEELGLTSTIKASNMTVFDHKKRITPAAGPDEIIYKFYLQREKGYKKRYQYLLDFYDMKIKQLNAKLMFIRGIIDGKIKVFRVPKNEIIVQLEQQNFLKNEDSYEYLLSMRIHSFTEEKMKELEKELGNMETLLNNHKSKTHKEIWMNDIKNLEEKLKQTKW